MRSRPSAAPGATPESGRPDSGTPWILRTLLVEDNRDTAESLALLLRSDGHQVLIAPDAASALQAAAEQPPDVALLDIGLPDLDGYQVARRLRGTVAPKRPLLVAITGRGSTEDRRRSQEAGIDLHLVKPIEPEPLLKLLRRFRGLLSASPQAASQ